MAGEKGSLCLAIGNQSKCLELPSGSKSFFPFGYMRTKALTLGTLRQDQVNGLIQSLK